jgi:hypothetical protein
MDSMLRLKHHNSPVGPSEGIKVNGLPVAIHCYRQANSNHLLAANEYLQKQVFL